MKELTIEQKAKAYDEAVENMRKFRDALNNHEELDLWVLKKEIVKDIEYYFPELKENEDEKIRKDIISYLRNEKIVKRYISDIEFDKWIAWLEKQGEKPQGKSALEAIKEEKVDNANKVEPKDYSSIDPHFFKTTDKVETKFKVGDFIVNDYCSGKVVKITDDAYLLDTGQGIPFSCEHNVHLWNVTKDAKEGDVLFHSDSASNGIFIFKEIIDKGFAKEVICYCDYDSEDHFCLGEHHTCCWADAKILHPATKEQRDTLKRAMTNAGWEFDFEKKELKKLGQSEVTKTSDQEEIAEIPFGAKDSELQEATYYIPQGFHAEIDDDKVVIKKGEKPTAWSEEDMSKVQRICKYLNEAKKYYADITEVRECMDWLKSLKDRYTWKPTEEQIRALHDLNLTGNISYGGQGQILIELYNNLKKLTE